MKEFDRFELLLWLIERFDNLRASVSNNASIVVSANALLIAALTFFLGTITNPASSFPPNVKTWAILCCATSFVSLMVSIYLSVNAIANVFKTSRQLIKSDVPPRFFFNQRETLEKWKSVDAFSKNFCEMDAEKFLELGIAELWAISVTQNKRYSSLRWSIRFFVAALLPLAIAVGMVLFAAS